MIQQLNKILEAQQRTQHYLIKTPIIESEILNNLLGHQFYFKVDALQKTGAFKVRAVLNHLLTLQEQNQLPRHIVTYSTGNHGIAVAYVCQLLRLQCRLYLPKSTTYLKAKIAKIYGAQVIYTQTRIEAEIMARNDGKEQQLYFLHPSDSDLSIAGSATMCLEALQDLGFRPDAIFASCGGGGLLSGSYLARQLLSPESLIFGCEPTNANDAFISRQTDQLFSFESTPQTIADGLIALKLSQRTFEHIQKLNGIFLVDEEKIKYWTIWLSYLLKITVEPSCALNMDGAIQWLKTRKTKQKLLILISGGNIDHQFYSKLWQETDELENLPSLY